MKLKNWILIAGVLACVLFIGLSIGLDANCCAWEEDCCCPDLSDWGLELEGYVCVCSPGGAPLIFRDCEYREIYRYPDPDT